jgi:hypothetical protein
VSNRAIQRTQRQHPHLLQAVDKEVSLAGDVTHQLREGVPLHELVLGRLLASVGGDDLTREELVHGVAASSGSLLAAELDGRELLR